MGGDRPACPDGAPDQSGSPSWGVGLAEARDHVFSGLWLF